MEKRDYLLHQIQEFGIVLSALVNKLLGIKESGKSEEIIEKTNIMLEEELHISLSDIYDYNIPNLCDNLFKTGKISIDNLEHFADVLCINASVLENKQHKQILYNQCIELYEYINKTTQTFSIERNAKIIECKDALGLIE